MRTARVLVSPAWRSLKAERVDLDHGYLSSRAFAATDNVSTRREWCCRCLPVFQISHLPVLLHVAVMGALISLKGLAVSRPEVPDLVCFAVSIEYLARWSLYPIPFYEAPTS